MHFLELYQISAVRNKDASKGWQRIHGYSSADIVAGFALEGAAGLPRFRNCAFVLNPMLQWSEGERGEACRSGNEGPLPTVGVHAHAAGISLLFNCMGAR